MQSLRGTKDILPNESIIWQHIYNQASEILALYNYHEIRTPILETTSLFERSIGNGTDIVNKEMYSFIDQGQREITLRPEGTASIVRAFISHKLYVQQKTHRLWYFGPMFRYERPQNGRQRQFHQLGIECIGSMSPMADAEVICLATKILDKFKFYNYKIEINSIGNIEERRIYKQELIDYLSKYKKDLDFDAQKKLISNPLKILDSKNRKTQEILQEAPLLKNYLSKESKEHFTMVCEHINQMNIKYCINNHLVRGLDYYNNTAFEIKSSVLGSQNTVCGGGRYDSLVSQLGGPHTPAVGWAIGIERLLLIIQDTLHIDHIKPDAYIATQGIEAQKKIWEVIFILEKKHIKFELDLNSHSFQKQLKKALKSGAKICLILGSDEVNKNTITIKWLASHTQKNVSMSELPNILEEIHKHKLDKVIL